jgi:hypothetical protein
MRPSRGCARHCGRRRRPEPSPCEYFISGTPKKSKCTASQFVSSMCSPIFLEGEHHVSGRAPPCPARQPLS